MLLKCYENNYSRYILVVLFDKVFNKQLVIIHFEGEGFVSMCVKLCLLVNAGIDGLSNSRLLS